MFTRTPPGLTTLSLTARLAEQHQQNLRQEAAHDRMVAAVGVECEVVAPLRRLRQALKRVRVTSFAADRVVLLAGSR